MKESVGILSLGCPRNLVDSEIILERLKKKGYRITPINRADIAILNTCAFIKEAKEESIEAILDLIELKKENKLKKILVYGCLPQRYGLKLVPHLKEVDAFVGKISLNQNYPHQFYLTPKHYSYIKISEGCSHLCSYCVIPKIIGPYRSRSLDSILEQIRDLDKKGISEINLIGQDISSYGIDLYGKPKLEYLLKKITKEIKRIRWVRLLYLHPGHIKDELLNLIKEIPVICKYIDLPIQHINDRILKLMNRNIKREQILKLLEKIRKKIPEVTIRTSVIVGFPTEKDSEFKELLRFISEEKFERLGVFTYSREEDTPAYRLPGQIPERIKLERFNTIMQVQKEISEKLNQSLLGKEMDVLVEDRDKDLYIGRSQADAPEVDGLVFIKSKKRISFGDFVKVKIRDTYDYDLLGEAL